MSPERARSLNDALEFWVQVNPLMTVQQREALFVRLAQEFTDGDLKRFAQTVLALGFAE